MNTHLIPVHTVCLHYKIEKTLIESMESIALIEIEVLEETPCLHKDCIGDIEKILRLYNDLHVNLEGIDIILNLLNKEKQLRKELNALKNKLRIYEDL